MLIRSTSAACPLCGAQHAVCGQAADSSPVDVLTVKESTVGTQRYRVTANGRQTVMKLSAEDAKTYPGAELVGDQPETVSGPPAKAQRAPNKARTAQGDK